MNLPERIATIIKVNQHSPATFADAIGVQRSSISHILNGRNKPSIDFLEKVLVHFPRVDAGWLITGRTLPQDNGQETAVQKSGSAKYESKMRATEIEEKSKELNGEKVIERIVIFYTDRTFATYEQKE